MDLSYGPEYDEYRAEIKRFLAEAWPKERAEAWDGENPDLAAQRDFIAKALDGAYLYRNIPKRYGGSEQPFDPLRERIIEDEFTAARAPWRLGAQGINMIVPTLLEGGAEWQREKFIPPTLRGEYTWCQGYSEPGAGSDLAALRSTARLEGDEWVINGHKVWTSDATDANYMFGMFRSEPDAKKHAGISYLLLEMDQPGIDVRPLRQITGATHFYEVFFTDVRCPADWIVGERGQGWQISKINLKHERNMGGGGHSRSRMHELIELARRSKIDGRPALEHADIRQRLAEIEGYVRCVESSSLRQFSAVANDEESDVALATLVTKLFTTNLNERSVRLGYDLLGDGGLTAPGESTYASVTAGQAPADWVDRYLFALCGGIAAGSSNIQRNVIGEHGLGLPRDLREGR